MLVRTSRLIYSRNFTLLSRFSSSFTEKPSRPTSLTHSYHYHASDMPLLYHTVGQHLQQLAVKHPNHECYVFKGEGNKRYTYKSFFDEVDSLATSLIELGFEKGDRLGVWLPNTSQNCVMSYATSRIGVIKVNINPAYMDRELSYCINKVGCKGLVMRPNVKTIDCMKIINRIAPELGESKGELNAKSLPTLKHVILTPGDSRNGNETTERAPMGIHLYSDLLRKGGNSRQDRLQALQSQLDGDTLLAVFYTSGTTGEPKAATLTNFNLLNNSRILNHVNPAFMRRACSPAPNFHILGETAGTLNIVVPGYFTAFPAILPDTLETIRTIHEEKCTSVSGAPIIFLDILHHPKRKEYDMSSLLFGIIGAAPVNPKLMEQLEREIPIKVTSQAFGQTENTGLLTASVFAGDDKQRRYGSVGKAIPCAEIKIVDTDGHILPIGQEGEVCARAFNIMKGYYGDEKKTRETITADGWLRTGDIGTMDEQGFIHFRTRRKEMIIVGGINVYPVEIENLLLEHPNIAQAQVFGIPDQRYGEVVCAWIKPKVDAKINDAEEIREFLRDKVAFFKIPKYIKVVDSFIGFMTSTGKVQKFKLTDAMAKELSNTSSKS